MKWTSKDLEIVRQHYAGTQNLEELSKAMGRTIPSIKCKACKLGIVGSVALSDKDYEYIKGLEGIRNIRDVAKSMGRSWNTVKKIIMELGLEDRYTPVNTLWNPSGEEIEIMKSMITIKQMRMKLGRSDATILKKIRQMGLNHERMKKPKREVIPKPPRIPKEKVIKIKREKVIRETIHRNDSGISRIREAMERINRI